MTKLFKQAEEAWKRACKRRDKYTCQLCGSNKGLHGNVVLQVDHCFSRKMRKIFFDVRNGTTLCRPCHAAKTWKLNGADWQVFQLVEKREGAEMMEWFISQRGLKKWTVTELEELIVQLNGMFN